jgi:DNA-binding CsgD family transcriptional regulator
MRAAALDRVHRLWDDLADFDASRVDQALRHGLAELAALVDAQNAFWMGVVRLAPGRTLDPVSGWRPGAIVYLHPTEPDLQFYERARRDVEAGRVDESTMANMRGAGLFRANMLRDLVSRAWYKSPFYDIAYRALHVVDAIFVFCPVNRDAESCFGFHRKEGHPRFTRAECQRLAYALRGVKWFHRQVMLSQGLPIAGAPLSRTEQRVLRLLLTRLSEKEIAARLGFTPRTTHAYVTEIFRRFNVSGRPGLTALWLGHPPAGPADLQG